MASYSWPTSLYGKILAGTYRETPPKNTIQQEMDAGPPKLRRVSTSGVREISMDHFFTSDDMVVFDEFFHTTLGSGALPFNYYIPRTSVLSECIFLENPSYSELNEGYRISTRMGVLP